MFKRFILWICGMFKCLNKVKKEAFSTGFLAMFSIAVPNDKSIKDKIEKITASILENKHRYINVARGFNMPWEVVAVIHYLECNLDFSKILHNGERLPIKKTRLVPKGRGPFNTWEEAARDALEMERKSMPSKWTIYDTLEFLEQYNGLGYRRRKMNSPYLWAGSQYYRRGKYSSDGKFKHSLVSKQVGAALILKSIGLNISML